MGMLLKLAVECCHQLAKTLKESPFLDATKVQKLQEYRARVKCAMIYAGMVQYKVMIYFFLFFHILYFPSYVVLLANTWVFFLSASLKCV